MQKKSKFNDILYPLIFDNDSATQAILITTKALYWVTGLQLLLALNTGRITAFFEPVLVIGLITWLRYAKKRWMAVVLFVWSFIIIFVTAQNNIDKSGGQNLFLAFVTLGFTVNLIRATKFLHAQKEHQSRKGKE